MLQQLLIKNLAIVQDLDISFTKGMNVITGETGAGKSILLNALNLTMGDRASSSVVSSGEQQAEISAVFDVSNLLFVQEWLKEQSLEPCDDCIVRRILPVEGTSKAYINGHIVTLAQLKKLGEMLVNMHSQHQHHALLSSVCQQEVLDQYAGHKDLLKEVSNSFKELSKLQNEYKELLETQNNINKLQLLSYQIQEIEELDLKQDELSMLNAEHKKSSKTEEILKTTHNIYELVNNESEHNILNQLHASLNNVKKLINFTPELKASSTLIEQAIIPLEELDGELQKIISNLNVDPDRLLKIEKRLSDIYSLARKHNITPEFIPDHYKILLEEKNNIENRNIKMQELLQHIDVAKENYFAFASKLSQSRVKIANNLTKDIEKQIRTLAMSHAVFKVDVSINKDRISINGFDNTSFLITTNPGQELQPLNKIASGGELSRISLAIQVILTKKVQASTLIFDEVDVGVSGATAEIVGKLLKVLGEKTQVLCVTHLPQVAAQGHSHFRVSKTCVNKATRTDIVPVKGKERVKEIARLLGGTSITEQAIANAESLLGLVKV